MTNIAIEGFNRKAGENNEVKKFETVQDYNKVIKDFYASKNEKTEVIDVNSLMNVDEMFEKPQEFASLTRNRDGSVVYYDEIGREIKTVDKYGKTIAEWSYDGTKTTINYEDRTVILNNGMPQEVDYIDGRKEVHQYEDGILKRVYEYASDGKTARITEFDKSGNKFVEYTTNT